jgi:endonuclease/exonuclease/phosphatase (EEP) superfamily protein YafD
MSSLLRHPGLLRRTKVLGGLCALGLLLPFVAQLDLALPDTVAWLFDLAVHWQWLYVAGLIVSLCLLVPADRRWVGVALLLPTPWLAGMPAAPDHAAEGPQLRVAGANVHLGNFDPAPLADWVGRARPDILVVLEVTDAFADTLSLTDAYPHHVVRPRSDPFGIALLSRLPVKSYALIDGIDDVPRVEAVIEWQGTEITVVAFHPMPPISANDHKQRNEVLSEMTHRLSEAPTLIIGDFNATPWSSAFAAPARNGFTRASGLKPTWPAAWSGMAGLPIDQVVVSRHWVVAEHAVGPNINSDHLPVAATVALRAGRR